MDKPVTFLPHKPHKAIYFLEPFFEALVIETVLALPFILDINNLLDPFLDLRVSRVILFYSLLLYLASAAPWTLLAFVVPFLGHIDNIFLILLYGGCPLLTGLNVGTIVYNLKYKRKLGILFLVIYVIAMVIIVGQMWGELHDVFFHSYMIR